MTFWLSRMCEEFPSLAPSDVLCEAARLPDGMLNEIVEARHYAKAKDYVEREGAKAQVTPMVRLVRQIEAALLDERRATMMEGTRA